MMPASATPAPTTPTHPAPILDLNIPNAALLDGEGDALGLGLEPALLSPPAGLVALDGPTADVAELTPEESTEDTDEAEVNVLTEIVDVETGVGTALEMELGAPEWLLGREAGRGNVLVVVTRMELDGCGALDGLEDSDSEIEELVVVGASSSWLYRRPSELLMNT